MLVLPKLDRKGERMRRRRGQAAPRYARVEFLIPSNHKWRTIEFHIEGKRILLAQPRKNMKKLITSLQYPDIQYEDAHRIKFQKLENVLRRLIMSPKVVFRLAEFG